MEKFAITVVRKTILKSAVHPHKKINQCLTNVNQYLTNIFKI